MALASLFLFFPFHDFYDSVEGLGVGGLLSLRIKKKKKKGTVEHRRPVHVGKCVERQRMVTGSNIQQVRQH